MTSHHHLCLLGLPRLPGPFRAEYTLPESTLPHSAVLRPLELWLMATVTYQTARLWVPRRLFKVNRSEPEDGVCSIILTSSLPVSIYLPRQMSLLFLYPLFPLQTAIASFWLPFGQSLTPSTLFRFHNCSAQLQITQITITLMVPLACQGL